jgi:hypothetical protein
MKIMERQSQWYHVLFSLLLCAAMTALIMIRKDMPSLIVVSAVLLYVFGNTMIHFRRRDFRTETLYEYLLIGAAVLLVLLGALRH